MAKRGDMFVSELSTAGVANRDAETYRALDAGLWAPQGSDGGSRAGVVVGSSLAIEVVSGTPESWRVRPGHVVFLAPNGQTYRARLPEVKTDVISRPTSTGQTRIDRFVARVYDSEGGYGGELSGRIERVQGDPSTGEPVVPAVPSGIVVDLGSLRIPNSGTITATSTTRRTAAAGGVFPVTAAERQQLVDQGSVYPGMVVWNTTTEHLDTYRGLAGGWSEDSGWVTVANAGTLAGLRRYRRIDNMVRAEVSVTYSGPTQTADLPILNLGAALAGGPVSIPEGTAGVTFNNTRPTHLVTRSTAGVVSVVAVSVQNGSTINWSSTWLVG